MKQSRGILALMISLLVTGSYQVAAQDSSSDHLEKQRIEQGAYLAMIGACVDCHTPYKPEYSIFEDLTLEQQRQIALFTLDTQDIESYLLAGGRPFDLGAAGIVYSRNLTSDESTGLGQWTDTEIENALRLGIRPDGSLLHPLMPYRNLNRLSKEDMTALIAYLRSLSPVKNPILRTVSGEGIAPDLTVPDDLPESIPPDADPLARGAYLVDVVMACSDCHTPLDVETGAPLMEQYLAGGLSFAGAWGVVYGTNITSDIETGVGGWADEELIRAFREGVLKEGRQMILMPWQSYAALTDDDLMAVIRYLKEGVPPVWSDVPQPVLEEDFLVFP